MKLLAALNTLCCLLAVTHLAWAQDLSPAEHELIGMVNQARMEAGVHPLTPSLELSAVARGHSRDMAENRFFSHVSPSTGDLGSRLRAATVPYQRAGENIALDITVGDAHQAFMTSPHHRENVIDPIFTHVGIGIVTVGNRIMVTQAFMNLREEAQEEAAPAPETPVEEVQPAPTPAVSCPRQPAPAIEVPEQPVPAAPAPATPNPGLLGLPGELGSIDPMPPAAASATASPPVEAEVGPIAEPRAEAQPAPASTPEPQAQEARRPPLAELADLAPGIWVISEDGTRQRVELGPDVLLRLLSAL